MTCQAIHKEYTQDYRDKLDYTFDWSDQMTADADALVTYELIPGDGATISDVTRNGAKITFWIESDQVGQTPQVACHVTTSGAREWTRTMLFHIAAFV